MNVPQEVITPGDAAANCPPSPKEKHHTTGNWIYDVMIYGSTAWLGVAVVSALSAHEAIHGNHRAFNWLRTLKTSVSEGMHNKLSTGLMRNSPKTKIDAIASDSAMFLMLGLGGCTLMGPLKWMEDNRQKNAACIDNMLGTTPPDPALIAHEPKQSWHSVLTGRVISWGSSYLAYLAMGPDLTAKISKGFGEAATNAWMHMRPHSNPLKVRRWADIAAFDATFTAITATATYAISRSVARADEQGTPATAQGASWAEKHPEKAKTAPVKRGEQFTDYAQAPGPETQPTL